MLKRTQHMAERITVERSMPQSSRRRIRGSSKPATRTSDEARALLEIKLTQLNSLLWCCYGDGNNWFEEAGEMHRDRMLWIAADLAREAEMLLQESGLG
jgi:hypothetical protein